MGDQLLNIMLVAEVEKRPILYNFQLPGYTKKHETDRAWIEIGKVVKLSADECKRRWKNIRAVFLRNMKLRKNGLTKDRKAYYLEDALQFTIPYIKRLRTMNSDDHLYSEDPLSTEDPLKLLLEEEDVVYADIDSDDDEDVTILQSSSTPPPTRSPSTSSTSTLLQHPPKKKRTTKDVNDDDDNDNNDNTVMDYLNLERTTSSVRVEQQTTERRKEAIRMFLLSMIPDLMQMDDQEVRQFKRKTLDAVDSILTAKSRRISALK